MRFLDASALRHRAKDHLHSVVVPKEKHGILADAVFDET
jgi:hypothetical protein